MKSNKYYPILIILSLFCNKTWAQSDSVRFHKRWTLSTDIVLYALNEKNLQFEVKISPRFAVGASYGFIRPYKGEFRNTFIGDHDIDPGRVYDGNSFRGSLKFYLSKRDHYYLQTSLLFKDLHYDTVVFHDYYAKRNINFDRSNEIARLYGADLLFGNEFIIENIIFIDVFAGIGYRIKHRSYTTHKSGYGSYSGTAPPLGDYIVLQKYLAGILGIKIGFCYSKK